MTRLAAPLILECPHCSRQLLQQRLASFNDFGATYWTDGYVDLFMVNNAAQLGSCPVCCSVFWVADATDLGPLSKEAPRQKPGWWGRVFGRRGGGSDGGFDPGALTTDYSDEWCYTSDLDSPRPVELLHGLRTGLASTTDQEIYLRTRLWWIANHRYRGSKIRSPMRPDEERENMECLLALMCDEKNSAYAVLRVGELLRALGRFEEAVALLQPESEKSEMAAYILRLAREGKRGVGGMRQEGGY